MKLATPTCLVIFLTALALGQSFPCRNFELPELSRDFIYLNYADAILHINDGPVEWGTGYLIEASQGYVITAAHVVKASIEDRSVPILGYTQDNNGKPLRLKLVHNLKPEGIDIALLQLVQSTAMADVVPLDIALRAPVRGHPFYVFGYPGDDRTLSQQPADYVQGNQDGTMTVKAAVYAGDSGSPLIDDTGKVVGTCSRRVVTGEAQVSNEAIYEPTSSIQELLKKDITITRRVRQLDNKVRSRDVTRDELSRFLLPIAGNISNVELYSWAWYLKFHPSPKIWATHFPCPILRALVHRKLEEAEEFLQQTDPATKAAVLIAAGQRFEFFNDLNQAAAKYKEAQALVAGLTGDPDAKRLQMTSLEALARVQVIQGDLDGAHSNLANAIDVSTNVGNQERQSDLRAQLAQVDVKRGNPDLAVDQLQKAIAVQGTDRANPITEATRALVTQNVTTVVGPSESEKSRVPRYAPILVTIAVIAVFGISFWGLLRAVRSEYKIADKNVGILSALFLDPETNAYSLSKTQFYAWTTAVLVSFTYLTIARSQVRGHFEFASIPNHLLSILAVSAATAIVAQGLNNVRLKGAGSIHPSLADLITTGGVVAAERIQFLLWTVIGILTVLLLVFGAEIGTTSEGVPVIPGSLMYLMCISSAAYLGGRLVRNAGPIIHQVLVVVSSLNLEIYGRNLSKDASFLIDGEDLKRGMLASDQNEGRQPEIVARDTAAQDPSLAKILKLEIKSPKQGWLTRRSNPDSGKQYHTLTVVNPDGQKASSLFSIPGPTAVVSASAGGKKLTDGTLTIAPDKEPQGDYKVAAVTFDASSSTPDSDQITSYEWYQTNELISSERTFSRTFMMGTHIITLKVADAKGQTDSATVDVSVSDHLH